jgi:hypothetical protein
MKMYGRGLDYWHPGYAWACTRKTYEKFGGLLDRAILGSGDHIMAYSLVDGRIPINTNTSKSYQTYLYHKKNKAKNIRIGYVPGVIRHHFHGSKLNRKYIDRTEILVKYKFDPIKHLSYNEDGLIIPSDSCPKEMLNDIMKYFSERNEDE